MIGRETDRIIGRKTLHATSLRLLSCRHKTAMKERRRCEGSQPWVKPTEQVKNPRNGETHGVHIPSPLEPQSGSKRSTQHISHPQRLGPIIIAPDDKNSTTGKKIARGCYWPPLRGSIGWGYANTVGCTHGCAPSLLQSLRPLSYQHKTARKSAVGADG